LSRSYFAEVIPSEFPLGGPCPPIDRSAPRRWGVYGSFQSLFCYLKLKVKIGKILKNKTHAMSFSELITTESEVKMEVKFLSNVDLVARLGKLVQTERKITHLILECIAEVDARRIYLERAYPSLYEFLIQEFGYSPSAAIRRIESARLLREVPEISQKIESGSLNLSQLSKMQQAVRTVQKLEARKIGTSEKRELLAKIENTTHAQTEVILAQEFSLPIPNEDREVLHRDGSVTRTITFSPEQNALLVQAQDLVSHNVPQKLWSEFFAYLAQKEVERRTMIRRPKVQASESVRVSVSPPVPGSVPVPVEVQVPKQEAGPTPLISFETPPRRTIRSSVRKQILKPGACCEFRDSKTGRQCRGTRFVQIDHRRSFWAGGTNEPENLQVLCAQHNRLKYGKEAGLHPKRW
jgi:hypothetical protein